MPFPHCSLRDKHKESLSLKNADEGQIQITNELNDMGKCKMPVEKRSFLKNAGLILN